MIAFDTNALLRMLIEDDKNQARIVQKVVTLAEQNSLQIIILPEVLIETVWVLESIYRCNRKEISQFLELLISTSTFAFPDTTVIRNAARHYKKVKWKGVMERGHPLKGQSREKTPLPAKKYIFFFACPLTFAPAQPRFIVTFFRTRYFFFIG